MCVQGGISKLVELLLFREITTAENDEGHVNIVINPKRRRWMSCCGEWERMLHKHVLRITECHSVPN